MIRLTSFKNGSPIYVPADVVIKENYEHEIGINNAMPTAKYKPLGGARVVYDGIEYAVKESQEEVARNVLEWRLAMVRYRVALSLENPNLWEAEEKKLKALAGLEESNHEVAEVEEVESLRKAKLVTDQQWRELVEENERLELDRNDWKDQAEKEYRRFREIDQEHMETKELLHEASRQIAELVEALRGILRYPPFEETNNGERFYEQMRDTAREVLRKYGLDGEEE